MPYGLLVSKDLLPLFPVVHLPGSKNAGLFVDLGKAETDGGFKPVIRDFLCSPKPGPHFCDEVCLFSEHQRPDP